MNLPRPLVMVLGPHPASLETIPSDLSVEAPRPRAPYLAHSRIRLLDFEHRTTPQMRFSWKHRRRAMKAKRKVGVRALTRAGKVLGSVAGGSVAGRVHCSARSVAGGLNAIGRRRRPCRSGQSHRRQPGTRDLNSTASIHRAHREKSKWYQIRFRSRVVPLPKTLKHVEGHPTLRERLFHPRAWKF
jgi:hypothetical protein